MATDCQGEVERLSRKIINALGLCGVSYLSSFIHYLAHYCLYVLLRVIRIERMAESSFFPGNKCLNREYRNTMWARESDSSCEPPYHGLDHAEVKGLLDMLDQVETEHQKAKPLM